MISASAILNEWGFNSEQELLETFAKEATFGICAICQKNIAWDKCLWVGGDPYCRECLSGDEE